jgi:hypothetical protein
MQENSGDICAFSCAASSGYFSRQTSNLKQLLLELGFGFGWQTDFSIVYITGSIKIKKAIKLAIL